jgi:hypothetical protein
VTSKPDFDLQAAHKYFSADCFNKAWDLIDKPNRTAAEDQQMLLLSMASAWHWTQRTDCTAQNLSIAYWQLSRVYALLRQADNARCYGEMSLEQSRVDGVELFCAGYAYEALARAEMVAGEGGKMATYLVEARAVSERMTDAEAKKMLLDDLATIK